MVFAGCRYPHIFTLHCRAHGLDLALEWIGELDFFKDAVDRAKKVVQTITNAHTPHAIFKGKSMLRLVKPGEYRWAYGICSIASMVFLLDSDQSQSERCLCMHPGDTRFYTAYILSARLFKCRSAARQTVVLGEWDWWAKKQGNREKAAAVKAIIIDEEFWAAVKMFCRLVKPIVKLLRLVDSNMPTMGKVRNNSHVDVRIETPISVISLTGCHSACRFTPSAPRLSSTLRMWALRRIWRRLSPRSSGSDGTKCTAHYMLLHTCWNHSSGAQHLAER